MGILIVATIVGVIAGYCLTKQPSPPPVAPAAAPATSSKPTAPPKSSPAPKKVSTLDKSDPAQKKRRDLIQKLIAEGVFAKMDTPGTLPRIYVMPKFYALDFDMQQTFMGVVYAYAFDGSDDLDLVKIMDSRTNKEVGSFSKMLGLNLK